MKFLTQTPLAILGALAIFSANPLTAQADSTPASYDSVMSWCQTWITDLENARWSANLEARSGNLEHAAAILFNSLRDKASEVGFTDPAPNTADAIRVGATIAVETFDASSGDSMSSRLRDQLRYLMLDSTYEMIEWTYYNLDEPYYRTVYDACRRGYCRDGYFTHDYYDHVRQLTVRLLNLQQNLAPMEADDTLELRVSRVVARGARDILLSSVLRRSLSCSIDKLQFTADQISRYLESATSIPRREQVQIVRELMNEANYALSQSGCGEWRR